MAAEAGLLAETVVLRLVGVATLVGQRQQAGGAKVIACVGGYGLLAGSACEEAISRLCNRPVRIPASWEAAVRCVLAARARAGRGPGADAAGTAGRGGDDGR